jgi:hypothetical protein
MVKFEYKCVSIASLGEFKVKELNAYGIDGWELVIVAGDWHYFKRKIEE